MRISLCTAVFFALWAVTVCAAIQPPAIPLGSSPASCGPNPRNGFVTASKGSLYLNGKLFNVRSMNAPDLFSSRPTDFRTIDTLLTLQGLGAPATRTYVLASVVNKQFGGFSSVGLITGWDHLRQDWVYNETFFQQVDRVLALSAQYGIKLIIPLVNQDYGTSDSDWVGNFIDLIRMRYNISDYKAAQAMIDWFTNMGMLSAFKSMITTMLTRKNTVNGRIYGHDDTILAWETGNEMNWGSNNNTIHQRPAPANWTIEVARHIKSLSPNTLVMDGSFSRNGIAEQSFPVDSLNSPFVDLFSYHYYGNGDQNLFAAHNAYVRSFGKTFVVGEHGFYSTGPDFITAYEKFAAAAGALVWSMRPHADLGGFETHSEGSGVFSYHFPGWARQTDPSFDTREFYVSRSTYNASWEVLGLPIPRYPVPGEPVLLDVSNATAKAVSWKGAAWAYNYELWAASFHVGFQQVGSGLLDNVGGTLFVRVDPSNFTFTVENPRLPYLRDNPCTWTDTKWSDPVGGHAHVNSDIHGNTSDTLTPIEARHASRSIPHYDSQMMNPEKSFTKEPSSIVSGTWYLLRGVSVDGVPGPFSKPLLMHA